MVRIVHAGMAFKDYLRMPSRCGSILLRRRLLRTTMRNNMCNFQNLIRIIEHEKDFSYLPNKRIESRTFTVVQRGRNLGSAQVAIEDFPNGSHTTLSSLRQ